MSSIQVESHPIFVRDNLDIICDVPISFVQAALGAEIDVPTLDGKVKMKIPGGTQSGKLFRMKGKGVKDVQGFQQGDQHVRVTVETPTHLTSKQKELLKEFAAIGGEDVNPLVERIFRQDEGTVRLILVHARVILILGPFESTSARLQSY